LEAVTKEAVCAVTALDMDPLKKEADTALSAQEAVPNSDPVMLGAFKLPVTSEGPASTMRPFFILNLLSAMVLLFVHFRKSSGFAGYKYQVRPNLPFRAL